MIQRLTFFIGILLVLLPLNQAQNDSDWCADSPSPPDVDPNWRIVPNRFEMLAELVQDKEAMEITQAFSTTRDSIVKNSARDPASFYWYYSTNEYFKVTMSVGDEQRKPDCTRQVINPDTQTSIIEEGTLFLKPSIILGFNPRNDRNPLWGIRYESNGILRDIPTNIFKSCFYINDINATAKVTYHVSDVTKFQAYLPANESLILQLDVNITNGERQQVYTYNVFRYISNPNEIWERQELETPSGVYCQNRTSEKPVPINIPDRIISNSESSLPTLNNSIFSSHNYFDNEYQFSRFDVWFPDPEGESDWFHGTEMHDFAVGLSYRFNHANRQCTVRDIGGDTFDAVPVDGNPNLFQMSSSQHLFLMDDITYQYTGEKPCRDRVWCNVWIGENYYRNHTVDHREWYWATRINNIEISPWIPIKLIGKRYVSGVLNYTFETNVYNYRPDPSSIARSDYTLADCYRALGPSRDFNLGVLSFRIANEKNYSVFENLNYLRVQISETVMHTLSIRPIRISHLVVDQDDTNDILITFTLLDAPPRTGPVEVPLLEPSLDTLISRLTEIINNGGLIFRAKSGTKDVILRTRVNSLNVAHRSKEEKMRSSGPLIIGLWIGCSIAGLLIGGIVSFFIFEKLAKK